MIDLLHPLAVEKGLSLQLEWLPELRPGREGDQQKVRQVLINLVGNALKFTDSGSVTVSLEGQLGWPSDKELELVRFEVKDTGVGIAEDQQQRLFEAFTQVDESISRGQGGSGLDLSISRQFVRGMGTQIGLESQLGQVSTFWFQLPLTSMEVEQEVREEASLVEIDLS